VTDAGDFIGRVVPINKVDATAQTSAAQTSLEAYRNGVGSISGATTAERRLLAANNAATDTYSNKRLGSAPTR